MNLGISPAVARVRFIGVVDNESTVHKNTESLRWFVVMLMRFGDPVRESEMTGIQTVGKRKLNQFLVRKDFFHLAAEGFVHAVIIIGIQKAAVQQIGTEALHLIVGEHDVPVTGKEEYRVRKEFVAGEFNELVPWIDIDVRMLGDEAEEVHFRRGVVVPVSAAAILESRNSKRALDARLCLCERCRRQESKKEKELK